MCDHGTTNPIKRRSVLGAALAGVGVGIAGSVGGGAAAEAATRSDVSTPRRPVLPVRGSQPTRGTMITQLGTSGGPQAEYVRTGTSTVLTVQGHNYVIDAGRSSLTQYLNAGLTFASLNAMFFTHLHADHLADYYNYFLLEGGQPNAEGDALQKPLTVYGPGSAGALPPSAEPLIAPANPTPGIVDLTNRLNEGYAYSYNIFLRDGGTSDIRVKQDIHDIQLPAGTGATALGNRAPRMKPFPIYEDDFVRVSAILVPHGKVFPAFAFRFDTEQGAVVFSGDTALSDNVVEIATGAKVLVHEVIDLEFIVLAGKLSGHPVSADLLDHLRESHTDALAVGGVAEAAGVSQLVLTHLVPSNPADIPDAVWKLKCSRGFRGAVHVGNDLDRITLPVRPR